MVALPSRQRQQRTLCRPVSLRGFGFWSSEDIHVELRPALPGTGVTFFRRDLSPIRRIPVRVDNQVATPRKTTLASSGVKVEMVEHILAALVGMQVDNCEIWVDSVEMPGCDGSSLEVVKVIREAGIAKQHAVQPRLVIHHPIRVGDDNCFIEATPSNQEGLWLEYDLDYPDSIVGQQRFELHLDPDSFQRELAGARTFVLQEEASALQARGLAQRATAQDLLVFDEAGLVDNELRFADECVRHKMLDVVGDLALAGCEVHGHIRAYRSGHKLNADLVKGLLRAHRVDDALRFSA